MVITGSDGFIGSALARRYPDADRVPAPDDDPPIGQYVHLGAAAGVEFCRDHPERAARCNITSTNTYLQHAKCRFVFASSQAATKPTTVYGATKAAGEALCDAYRHEYGLSTLALRFVNVYGPGSLHKGSVIAQMMKDAIAHGEIRVHGDGTQSRHFLHVEDAVSAIQQALDSTATGVAMVAPNSPHTIGDLAVKIQRLSGARIVQVEARHNDTVSPLNVQCTLRGWKPTHRLQSGLRETWEWFKEHYTP